MASDYILDFSQIRMSDVARVGGKNASLGELYSAFSHREIGVLDGFAITTDAYWRLLKENGLREKLDATFTGLNPEDIERLAACGQSVRSLIMETPLPQDLQTAILDGYRALVQRLGDEPSLAVRSSASAEDLPEASFAGAAETFLNVHGEAALLRAVHQCFASLFTDRAINYRARQGYSQLKVALSVGIMPMVRSDKACSGVMFTLDTESGFRNVVTLTGAYGLGEFVVQGVVTPDEWTVFKPTLKTGHSAIIGRRLGSKEVRLIYGDGTRTTRSEATPAEDRGQYCLVDSEVLELSRWGCMIEDHYSKLAGHLRPMDIEWAKDGVTGKLYIVQARPETVHSAKTRTHVAEVYRLRGTPGSILVRGQAVGERIGSGKAHVVTDVHKLNEVQAGEILVASSTDPDWEPVMRRVAGIVTDQGGRTAHAAIVSREFGIPCIVGTGNATQVLKTGQEVTVCCTEGSEGHVYSGLIPFQTDTVSETRLPQMRTRIMLIVGDPAKAFDFASIPNNGVGLARIEFIITSHIGIHPMALANLENLQNPQTRSEIRKRIGQEDAKGYFIRRLSEGIGRIGAAFYPNPVIVRLSDFKTNEYANLMGGAEFELHEENPMIGFRGASRYYDERYAAGFALECFALARVRDEFGLTNVKVMVPFCRTVEEGRKVIATMAGHGLKRGANGLEIYAMCEIPANVVLAEQFLKIFDGYSIGSNDLTQLTLGIDRDSAVIAHLFDENNGAVRWMIAQAIRSAHAAGKPIGICGQAPSDFPEFAEWLVEQGIDSISLNPDTALQTALRVARAEMRNSLQTVPA
ncbi:MAG TPA: phosphoenolpyruvate synthase [Alloacidobacterium sp.]|nr:phosphoenolpyruvate synthase [Alloacidobacterium sp.]